MATSTALKVVAFKGDNGKYLKSVTISGKQCLQLSADDSKGEETHFQLQPNYDPKFPDKEYKIRSEPSNKVWELDKVSLLVLDKSDPNNNSTDVWFTMKVAGDHLFAIKSVSNNMYCQRYSQGEYIDCLFTYNASISDQAKFTMEEVSP